MDAQLHMLDPWCPLVCRRLCNMGSNMIYMYKLIRIPELVEVMCSGDEEMVFAINYCSKSVGPRIGKYVT